MDQFISFYFCHSGHLGILIFEVVVNHSAFHENHRAEMQASKWPQHPQFLIPGVNDSWNDFQKFCKGKAVTGKEWKQARQLLHEEYQKFIAEGGSPTSINEETQRFSIIPQFFFSLFAFM